MIEDVFARCLLQDTDFRRMTDLWIRQYQKLQHFGGTICIKDPEDGGREATEGLFSRNYQEVRDISIPYFVWEEAIKSSRFAGSGFLHILETYEGENTLTSKEQKEIKAQEGQRDMQSLSKHYACTKAGEWLNWTQETNHKSYGNTRQPLNNNKWQTVCLILSAINQLPVWKQEIETMTVFTPAVTQDPHFFDKDIKNTLPSQGVCYFLNVGEQDISLVEKNKLYCEASLLEDDSSNSCMIAHLNVESRGGKVYETWKGFFDRYETWAISLYNLQQIHNISNAIKVVYIVENPLVFRSLFLEGKRLGKEQIDFVCTDGQLDLYGHVLLGLVQKNNIPIYYVGDLDPEGILTADRLKQRYKDDLYLWRSTMEDYHRIMSTSLIREKRLLSLQDCRSEELQALRRELEKHACGGHQEALLPLYIEEIKSP